MNEQAKSEKPVKPAKPPGSAKSRIALLLALLAILISILGLVAVFFSPEIIKTIKKPHPDVTAVKLQQIEPVISELQDDLNKQKELLDKLQNQPAPPSPPTAQTSLNINELVLAEADYLVTIAYYNLMFAKDIDATIKLLENVDQKLQQANDPTLMPIRQSLASDIVALKALPKLDIAGIILRLNAIGDQINGLISLPIKEFGPPKPMTAPNHSLTLWEKITQSLSKLKDVVVIRRTDEPLKPLLLPEQQFYVQQNILLQINKAQWAVLHQDQAIYESSLQKTIDLLKTNFSQDPKTKNIAEMLTNLKAMNVKPNLPDLSKTINLLHSALATKATTKTDVTNPAPPKPTARAAR